MKNNTQALCIAIINGFIFAILIIFHYQDNLIFGNLRLNPISLIPFLVAFSMFNKEWVSTVSAMVVGFFIDSGAAQFSAFHTFLFMILALFVSFSVRYLFNNNIKTAIVLSVGSLVLYFLVRWLFFYAFEISAKDGLFYLMYYALPSVLVTTLFIFPFYFLERKLDKLKIG